MTDEQQPTTEEQAVAPKSKRAAAPKKTIVEQEETNEVPKSDKAIHIIILGSLIALAVAGTAWLNANGLLGDSKQKIHDLETQSQAYRDGIRDARH